MSQHFHAHVYFTDELKTFAEELYSKLGISFSASEVRTHGLRYTPVGPHPLPMFELNFFVEQKVKLVSWLEKERGGLSVLIHEDTGDDERDHSTNVQWLGKELPVDFTFFEKIKSRPDLKIHQ